MTDFENFSSAGLVGKFTIEYSLTIPPHLKRVATLPCEIFDTFLIHSGRFLRHSLRIRTLTDRLLSKCQELTSSVTRGHVGSHAVSDYCACADWHANWDRLTLAKTRLRLQRGVGRESYSASARSRGVIKIKVRDWLI